MMTQRNRLVASTPIFLAVAVIAGCGGNDDDVTVPQNNGLPADTAAYVAAPDPSAGQYQLHLASATANAGTDPFFKTVLRPQWCYNAEHSGAPPELADHAVVPITQVFDNTYFTGMRWVGQYVFKVQPGLFLLDTHTSTADVQNITEPQLRAAGLDPASIFAAMPTHGHADHYGGAAYLQGTYHIPIYLGSADAADKPFVVTPLNSAILVPQPTSFGSLNTVLLSTPGHTPGTFSGILPVSFKGVPYKVAFWGGTALPAAADAAKQYLDGTERLWALAEQQNIAGTIHTHPFVDGSLEHIDAINAAGGYDKLTANPFLLGHASAMRSLAVLRECSAANVGRLDSSVSIAEWRVAIMDVASTWVSKKKSNSLSVSVRVKSPYAPIAGGTVSFAFAPGGESCTATPDANGIATCTVSPTSATPATVTASFSGTVSETVRTLPTQQTGEVKKLD